jgi:hypothetical protein
MSAEQPVLLCSSCGAPLEAGATSCHFCGAQLAHAAGVALVATTTGPAPGTSPEIEALRGSVARAHGLFEQQYAYTSATQCAQFANKLGGLLRAVSNEVLAQDGRPIRVNYLHAASPDDARRVYQSMVAQVGKTNLVARKGDVVVEVISGDPRDVDAVTHALQPDETNRTRRSWW